MLHWDDLRILLAVARRGSHAAAAKALAIDATTVGRRLRALEQALGTKLVERRPDGLVLTEAGRRASLAAESAADVVDGLERAIAGGDERDAGVVRLTASDGLLVHLLAPAVTTLRARHPRLELQLLASTRSLDLARREADLALRLGRPREAALVGRKLASLPFGLFASKGYLDRMGAPRRVSDLAERDWLLYDDSLAEVPEMRWIARHVASSRVALRASSSPVLRAACEAGLGIAAFANVLVEPSSGLVPVLPRASLPAREAWVVMHPDLRAASRVRIVVDWLAETLNASR